MLQSASSPSSCVTAPSIALTKPPGTTLRTMTLQIGSSHARHHVEEQQEITHQATTATAMWMSSLPYLRIDNRTIASLRQNEEWASTSSLRSSQLTTLCRKSRDVSAPHPRPTISDIKVTEGPIVFHLRLSRYNFPIKIIYNVRITILIVSGKRTRQLPGPPQKGQALRGITNEESGDSDAKTFS